MRRLLAACGAAIAMLGVAAMGAPIAAPATASAPAVVRADANPDPIRITLTRLNPAILTETGNLLITGRIANGSFTQFSDVMVQLRLSYGPLETRAQLSRVTSGNSTWDGDVIPNSTISVAPVLGVGGEARFRIELPVTSLGLGTPGAYGLGVEVVASDGEAYDRRAMTRILLPWMPTTQQVAPTRLAWLWPLSNAPARDQRGVLLGTATQDELSPGGRLRSLLDIGSTEADDVSWVADPALLQTADAMTNGYLVDIDGTVEPGTRSAQARAWLSLVNAATVRSTRSTLWTLPYANVDAEALLRHGLDRDLVRSVTTSLPTANKALGHTPQGGLAWAPRGNFDPATIDALAGTGVRVVVMRDSALPPTDTSITPSGSAEISTASGPVRAVLLDSGLREALSMRQQTSTQILLARQRFLSELAFVSLEAPTIPRTLIAGPSNPRWDPSAALLRDLLRVTHSTPWIDPVPLDVVLADEPSQVPRTTAPYASESLELPGYYLDRITSAQNTLDHVSTVLEDPAALTEPSQSTLLRAESSAWRFHLSQGEALIASVESALRETQKGVHIISRSDVILSGDTGSVPVTISNELDQQVTVGLRLVGTPSARLESAAMSGIVIQPGKRASVVVPVRVVGSDSVQVLVQVLDATGAQFGTTSTMQLKTTAYSRAARWFTIGAAILLLIMVFFDIYRRIRNSRRKRSETASESGPVIST